MSNKANCIPFFTNRDRNFSQLLAHCGAEFSNTLVSSSQKDAQASSRYCYFFSCPDVGRIANNTENNNALDEIPEKVLADARANKCKILIDTSNEGIPFSTTFFDPLLRWAMKNKMPSSSMILINQNRLLEKDFHDHYGQNTAFEFSAYDLFLKMIIVKFSTLYDDVFHKDFFLNLNNRPSEKSPYAFLCYNGVPRAHRAVMVAEIFSRGWEEKSLISFLGDAHGKAPMASHAGLCQYATSLTDTGDIDIQLASLIEKSPILIDNVTGLGNQLAGSIDPTPYLDCQFSLVTETEFTASGLQRITEKSLKPILFGQPALIAGNPRSLEILHELGLQTFAPIIDEYYDYISEPKGRLTAIFKQMDFLFDAWNNENLKVLQQLDEIGSYNMAYAGKKLKAKYESLYEDSLVELVDRCFQTA